jgi:hypothetical protein
MHKLRLFRQTDLSTDCDECGGRVDLLAGGTCERCRRILCERHLHGSWTQRLLNEFRRPLQCVRCRAERGAGAGAERTDDAEAPARD